MLKKNVFVGWVLMTNFIWIRVQVDKMYYLIKVVSIKKSITENYCISFLSQQNADPIWVFDF